MWHDVSTQSMHEHISTHNRAQSFSNNDQILECLFKNKLAMGSSLAAVT